MKVCILTTSFPLGKGDISGMFVLEKARHLVRQGVDVTVLAPHHVGAPLNEVFQGIKIHRFRYFVPERFQRLCYGSGIPNNIREYPWTKIQIPILLLMFIFNTIIHGRNSDIIHAHWSLAGLAGYIVARLFNKPVVLTMHQGTTRSFSFIERLLLEKVDYVLCNSSYTHSHVISTARPKRIKIIPPSVDIEKFKPIPTHPEDYKLILNTPSNKIILFTLGRLVEWKGHRYLIQALKFLTDTSQCHLLIGGEGTLYNQLKQQVQEENLAHKVNFLGHIPGHLLPKYYSLADIYVQPSIIDKDGTTEGLGVTLLEALSCGTPCIGSRVGGIPDVILEGKNGYLSDPGNPQSIAEKISLLANDKKLRDRLGKQGRDYIINKFSWEVKAREHIEIYTMLNAHKKKNPTHG